MITVTPTNVTFDAKKFLARLAQRMRNDLDFAYPCNQLSDSRAHQVLQKLYAHVGSLETFLEAVEELEPNEGAPQ